MRNKFIPTLVLATTMGIFFISSCQKINQDVVSSEVELQNLSITEAKAWYNSSANNSGSLSNARTDSSKNKLGKFTPLWDKAINTEDDKYWVVESVLRFDEVPGYLIKTAAKSPAVPINGATKLLILKNKKTGEMKSALMHIYSLTGAGAEKIIYGKKDEKFSGHIFFTDLNGLFVNGWIYENGKIIKQSKGKLTAGNVALKESNIAVAAPPDEGGGGGQYCETYEIRWYERDCNADYSQCGDWQYLGSTYQTYCTENGSGSGGGGSGGGYEACRGCVVQKDCAGVENGTAYRGDCGVCIGGTTGLISCDDPCAEKLALAMKANDSIISNQNSSILTNTTDTGKEYGTEHNLQSTTGKTYMNTTVRRGQTSNFTPNFTWNSTDGYTVGASHGHPSGMAPSPGDAAWAASNLTNAALPDSNKQFYKDNVSVTAVTSTATYIVTPKNWNSLQTKANDFYAAGYTDANGNPGNYMNDNYVSIAQQYMRDHQSATVQEAGAFALMKLFGDAINLYKATAGTTTFTPLEINTNAVVGEYPCQ